VHCSLNIRQHFGFDEISTFYQSTRMQHKFFFLAKNSNISEGEGEH